jgi:hypothetical protein
MILVPNHFWRDRNQYKCRDTLIRASSSQQDYYVAKGVGIRTIKMRLVYPHERRVMSVPVTPAVEMRITLGWQGTLAELAEGLRDEVGTW